MQRLNHPNIVNVGTTAYLIEYRQQYYTAFTVDSVETDLQQLIEVCVQLFVQIQCAACIDTALDFVVRRSTSTLTSTRP